MIHAQCNKQTNITLQLHVQCTMYMQRPATHEIFPYMLFGYTFIPEYKIIVLSLRYM